MTGTYIQMIAAFIFVVLLILAAGSIMKKKQNKCRLMSVISYQSLGQKKGVAALKVGKEVLLLGITQNEMRLLKVFDENELELPEPESFQSKLKKFRSSEDLNPGIDSDRSGI